jgi:hypothetical protein
MVKTRVLKKGKNPKRVAAGKKAWRKAHRSGGKMTKRKGSKARHAYRRVRTGLGRTVKAVIILAPAVFSAWNVGRQQPKGQRFMQGLLNFQTSYTGLVVDSTSNQVTFEPGYLAIGWGPALVIGGIQYGLKAVHQEGVNPFRVMSTLG